MKEKFENVTIKFDTVEQRDHLYDLANEAGLDLFDYPYYEKGFFRKSSDTKYYGQYSSTNKLPVIPYADFVSYIPNNRRISSDLISAIESSMVNPQHNNGEAFIRAANTPTAHPADAIYDFINSQGLSYELGNAVNFICKANNGKKQALYNAKWYIEKAIEHETKTN